MTIDYRDLALRANQSLLDGQPLVLEAEAEKIAFRSYAEFQAKMQESRIAYKAWLKDLEHGDSPQ